MRAKWKFLAAGVSLAGLLACLILGGGLWLNSDLGQLYAARQKWQAQEPARYTLTIQHEALGATVSLTTCLQEIEVRAGRVTAIRNLQREQCLEPVQSVAAAFELIEALTWERDCGPNNCSCDGPLVPRVKYSAEWGYPAEIRIQPRFEQRQLYAQYWQRRFFGGNCSQISYIGTRITITAFAALP